MERRLIAKVKSLLSNDLEGISGNEYAGLQAFCEKSHDDCRFQDVTATKGAASHFVDCARFAMQSLLSSHIRLACSFLDIDRVDEDPSGISSPVPVIFRHGTHFTQTSVQESLLDALSSLEGSRLHLTAPLPGDIGQKAIEDPVPVYAHLLCICILALSHALTLDPVLTSVRGLESANGEYGSRPAIRLAERILMFVATFEGLRPASTPVEMPEDSNGASPLNHSSLFELMSERFARALKLARRPHYASVMAASWHRVLQEAFSRSWTGAAKIEKPSLAAAALEAMRSLWHRRDRDLLGIKEDVFHMPSIVRHIGMSSLVSGWLASQDDPGQRHILSYQFLFERQDLILAFRTACHIKMRKAFGDAEVATLARSRMSRHPRPRDDDYLDRRMKVDLQHFLVLKVSRESVIDDALDQLWQREARELLRPLRVRMGIEEGEIGHDLGGVQVEFFNLVCMEMFDTQRSIFITDPQTHLSWFRSGSFEPLYRHELIGLLFGLAVYNGITLPVSFPLVFYRKLLGYKSETADLDEGWPSVAKSLRDVLAYDGDVSELGLDYVYNLEASGTTYAVDMIDPWSEQPEANDTGSQPDRGQLVVWPSTQQETEQLGKCEWPGWDVYTSDADVIPDIVDNNNRKDYVDGYARWVLDYSIRPQFYAFARGFYRVVDPRALRILPADLFRQLVEGHTELDVKALKAAATYEGYDRKMPIIKWFWEVVASYSQEKQKLLLEFVTASRRVPVNGASSLTFRIEKLEGRADQLPGSSTCFGTLRLPGYESKEELEKKLDIALEHSLGFGQA